MNSLLRLPLPADPAEPEKAGRPSVTQQPPPSANASTPLWEQVIDDMRARDAFGRRKYNVPLQTHNGRNFAVDHYQELLDAIVYAKGNLVERAELLATMENQQRTIQDLEDRLAVLGPGLKRTPQKLPLADLHRLARIALMELKRRGCVCVTVPVLTYPNRLPPHEAPWFPCEIYSVRTWNEFLLVTIEETYPQQLAPDAPQEPITATPPPATARAEE